MDVELLIAKVKETCCGLAENIQEPYDKHDVLFYDRLVELLKHDLTNGQYEQVLAKIDSRCEKLLNGVIPEQAELFFDEVEPVLRDTLRRA